MIIENFKVEDHSTSEESIERTRPFTTVAVAGFKPLKHFSFEVGAGGEFAKEGNYFLTRLGFEYNVEITHSWELIANAIYDVKWNAYNNFSFGIGIAKSFRAAH